MSYESPINLYETTQQIADDVNKSVDEYIYKSILNVGVDVDRDELIRALRYDRDQYEKGYRDGQRDIIVRCKDCISRESCILSMSEDDDWFCADGKRRDSE